MFTRSVAEQERSAVSKDELEQAASVERWLRAWVTRLAIPRSRLYEPRANRRVEQDLAQALSDMGYQVTVAGSMRNIVAIPPGGSRGRTLIGAHFDSVPNSPGADDNASGVAALLRCAYETQRAGIPTVFVAFNAEEEGLVGSREFVASGLCANLGIRDAHVLEMVGYRARGKDSQRAPNGLSSFVPRTGDFIGLIANSPSRVPLERALGAAKTGTSPAVRTLEVFFGLERQFGDLLRSDHAPLWSAGIPTVLWTDTAEFRNANYHQRTDTAETLDYSFLRQIGDLLFRTLREGAAAAS